MGAYNLLRTNASILDDLDLSIMDEIALFPEESKVISRRISVCAKGAISAEQIHQHFNGLLKSEIIAINDKHQCNISLTQKGGQIWENERRPKWCQYCRVAIDDDLKVLEVDAGSVDAVRYFIEYLHNIGLCDVRSSLENVQEIYERIFYWKDPVLLSRLRARVSISEVDYMTVLQEEEDIPFGNSRVWTDQFSLQGLQDISLKDQP